MFFLRNILSATLLLALLSPCVIADKQQERDSDIRELQRLLNDVDPPSIHAALHEASPKKFKHGMFQDDRTALEVIHKEEPSLATSIIALAKRQNQAIRNGSTPISSPNSIEPATTRVTPIPQGGQSSSTPAVASSPVITTSANAPASTSTANKASTSAAANAPSSATTAADSSTPSSSPTAGEVITSTNSVGVVIVTTVGGGASTINPSGSQGAITSTAAVSSQTSTVVQTSTFPDGSKSTLTSVMVVGAGIAATSTPSGTAGAAGSTKSGSGSPGLQNGATERTGHVVKEMVGVMVGAVGVAMLM